MCDLRFVLDHVSCVDCGLYGQGRWKYAASRAPHRLVMWEIMAKIIDGTGRGPHCFRHLSMHDISSRTHSRSIRRLALCIAVELEDVPYPTNLPREQSLAFPVCAGLNYIVVGVA